MIGLNERQIKWWKSVCLPLSSQEVKFLLLFGIQACLCCKETGVLDLNCNIEDYIKELCVRLSGIAMWGRIREMVNTPCMSEWPFSLKASGQAWE